MSEAKISSGVMAFSLSLQFGGQEFAKELHSLTNTKIVDFFLDNSCFLVVSTSKLFTCQT